MSRRRINRKTWRLGLWLALLAMGLNALWPLLADAMPMSRGADGLLLEVCTAGGMRLAAPSDQRHVPDDHGLPHCGFCVLGADRAPLPANLPPLPRPNAIALSGVAPAFFTPTLIRPPGAACARAPPSFS